MKNYAFIWKKHVNFRQISYDDFVRDFSKISGQIFSEKVDGMLGVLVYGHGKTMLQTSTGHEIVDVPCITEYEAKFKKHGITEAIIPGELVARKSGKILPFNQSQSIVRTSHIEKNKPYIFHYPYDIYSLNNKKFDFKPSLLLLTRFIYPGSEHIRLPAFVRGGMDDFRKLYLQTKDNDGFDGVVARDINGKNYKIKFTSTVDLVVIGAGHEEMKAWKKGQVSYLLSSFIDKDGLFRSSSKVGTGFTEIVRKDFYKQILTKKLYGEKGNVFIKPEIIIEMKFFRSRLIETPTYQFKDGIYRQIGNKPSITFSHPSFVRLREDKRPTKYDVRLEQIPEFMY